MKDRKSASKKKKRFLGALERHLSFWVSGVESQLIFYIKKEKEKLNIKIHD